jgi:predicted LPLAT superfamily acyltransferase
LLHRTARRASFDYIRHIYPDIKGIRLWLYSFRHFANFGQMLIDKLAVWNSSITMKNVEFSSQTRKALDNAMASGKGGVIFAAHFGNIEVARALSKYDNGMKVTALVFSKNAQKLNNILTKINPDYNIGMVSLQKPTPDLAIQLCELIEKGEFVVITGDRTSVTQPQRNQMADFLGEKAPFPQGAFILSSLLDCPAYFMVCPKIASNKFEFIFDDFAPNGVKLERKHRKEQLDNYTQKYATKLEDCCHKYPLQWFNFFDFWHRGDSK